jgi:exportin-2 (importin alpha re-exporter)
MIVSSSSFPGTFNSLESKVVPHMFQILQADQSDLFPYAFQLLAVIIEFNPRPDFPDYLNSLLPVVLQPALWSTSCNIPGLVRFLQSCFAKNPGFFISSQVIESIISIFRILVNSKINDVHGFNLMASFIGILSADDLSKYIRPVLILILGRIQAHKSQKLGSYFLLFICYIVVESKVSNGASFIIQNLNQIQPNIHFMLFKSLFIPVISRIQEPSDKKLLVFGISQIFIELQSFIQGSSEDISLW